ncbi:lysylphosphatidylglycerol synthase transmembrane domain-containing protein [Bacillus sp. T3]|uniref:lysylphosphatidylglycerol synthase transmembrane domain-containing protein n=1 Tax=Bacillus sp. T3 TaxID=467262 RepID=UPI00298211DF|nr:lysylphosphatidylglycerol synthase transmembrane domain-containing protein [Bacillus sp. T3]
MEAEISEQKHLFRPKLKMFIRLVISGSLITWLIYKIQWESALQLMKGGNLVFFIAAFIAIQLTVASSVWKWQLLVHSSLKDNERHDTSYFKLWRYYYIGLFFNNFMPGSIGGDAMRIFYLGKRVGMPQATASVAFERLTSGIALTVIVLISSLFMESVRPFMLPIFVVVSIIVVMMVILSWWMKRQTLQVDSGLVGTDDNQANRLLVGINKVIQALCRIGNEAENYHYQGRIWWLIIGVLSLLFQIGLAWINRLLFLGFGIVLPWLDLIVIISLISFITMLPVSLNGMGVRETCYILFFKELGVPDEIAVAVSLLFFIQVTISSLGGGLFLLFERRNPN